MKEIRTLNIESSDSESRELAGVAIVFNAESEIMYDKEKRKYFREVIAPEAITDELIQNSDVRFLYNHNNDKILARSNKGCGSLKIVKREDGVAFSFDAPNTSLGNDVRELVKDGTLTQCSFAFTYSDCKWDFTEKIAKRTITRIDGLYDLSIVTVPAYPQTSVTARGLEELIENEYSTSETHLNNLTKIEEIENL